MTADTLVGLYGGTFDPPHLGHMHVAETVMLHANLANVRWIPSARPPHRATPGASIEQRWDMVRLMLEQRADMTADDSEIRHPGKSFTFETVERFNRQHPDATACWILGHDAYATLDSWYNWQNLLQICNLIVVQRPGDETPVPEVVQHAHHEAKVDRLVTGQNGQVLELMLPMLPVSSTLVRQNALSGKPFADLLAGPVYTYIKQHKLYSEINV